MEYRVLSNHFIKSKELVEWVFNNIKLALENLGDFNIDADRDIIVKTINSGDKELALQLCEKYNIPILELV